MQHPLKFALALGCLLAAGCGDDETQVGVNVCDVMSTPYDAYAAGTVKEGKASQLKIVLMDAVPAPPTKGDNSWTLQILDMSDAPMSDATVTSLKPFMPDHGHGTNVMPEIGDVGADGTVEVDKIDFRMPGVWTVTVSAETMSASDEAVFAFCIDG